MDQLSLHLDTVEREVIPILHVGDFVFLLQNPMFHLLHSLHLVGKRGIILR